MKHYNKALCTALLAGFIGSLLIGLIMLHSPSYASVSGEDYDISSEDSLASEASAHSTLYYELKASASSLISDLQAIPDNAESGGQSSSNQQCLAIYMEFSGLFDSADEAYDNNSIDNAEYASVIEMLNELGAQVSTEFERLGFDPYATELAYSKTLTSENISGYVKSYQWSAGYNGSNIIVNFNISIGTYGRLQSIYIGNSGSELLYVAAYGYLHPSTDPVSGAQYFSSKYGSVTLTSLDMGTYRTTASGYITITNPSGFNSWYNSGARALSFKSYSDSGVDYEYSTDGSTGMNPTNISNITEATTQGLCSHSYSCTAVDAASHKTACTKCSYTSGTAAHDSSLSDTSSSPGYTIKKCSACGYAISSTSNNYSVVIEMGTGDASDNLTITATYNQSMPDITVPSRLGYAFLGCYAEADGGGTQYYLDTGKSAHVYDLTSSATLYSHWKRTCAITSLPTVENEFACIGD